MRHILVIVVIAFFGASCTTKTGVTNSSASNNSYTILAQGEYGGRETESNEVLHSVHELEAVYRELNLGEVPLIDFSTHNVVVVFLGEKNTGGFTIGIKNVVFTNDTATVNVSKLSPEGNMATMAITNPFCIAAITKTEKVLFK